MSDDLNRRIWRGDFEKSLANIVGWMPVDEAIGIFLAKYGQTTKPVALRAVLEEVAVEMRGDALAAGDVERSAGEKQFDGLMGSP